MHCLNFLYRVHSHAAYSGRVCGPSLFVSRNGRLILRSHEQRGLVHTRDVFAPLRPWHFLGAIGRVRYLVISLNVEHFLPSRVGFCPEE